MAAPEKSDNVTKFQAALEDWNKAYHDETSFDPIPLLDKLACLLEQETEEFFKMDPDPLDDRPPGRQIPTCGLSQMMKCVFKNEEFMNSIVGSYLLQGSYHNGGTLFTAACRVLLVLLPGLETSVPFREMEGVVERLYYWAEFAAEPLKSYATGLLSGAMELNDMAVKFRDESIHMVPIMIQRLHALMNEEKAEREKAEEEKAALAGKLSEKKGDGDEGGGGGSEASDCRSPRYFAMVGKERSSLASSSKTTEDKPASGEGDLRKSFKRSLSPSHSYCSDFQSHKRSKNDLDPEHSNSSWAEMRPLVIGSYSLHPLTSSMKQRLILQYLTPLGDYHELLSPILEHDAMSLIFYYVNLNENKDIRLAFDALRFLSVILCHKKFAAEFIAKQGIQRLLQIHRPSIAAIGVSLCFYYITYFEDATERMCSLPTSVLSDLVSYNLWLMECSHDSSRCHACLFFSQSFAYKIILDLFDQKDGLRRLVNVISTLNMYNPEDRSNPTDDELHQMRQAARLVCEALRKYFEVHTILKADEIRCVHHHDEDSKATHVENLNVKSLKSAKVPMEENLDLLLECLPPKASWAPELHINRLGGLSLLCQLIAMSPEWDTYPGKTDTIVAALETLAMCAVSNRTLLLLCRNVNLPGNVVSPIMSVLVGLVEGEIINEAEVQKAALKVICNCVCGPVEKFGQSMNRYHSTPVGKKKGGDEDLLSTMWNCLRINNGIMVLLKLLSVKTPIVEADRIRTLACKALAGMSRSETIRQIIGKRPPLNNGQLQSLVKEPVLADKRVVHLQFCKFASILLEKIAGKDTNVLGATTLQEIRRAGVVAQTIIVYQDKELLQLIHEHLTSKGLYDTATALLKEAGLPKCSTPPPLSLSGHLYSPSTPKAHRQLSHPNGPSNSTTNGPGFSSREMQSPSMSTLPPAQHHGPSSSSSSTTGRVSPLSIITSSSLAPSKGSGGGPTTPNSNNLPAAAANSSNANNNSNGPLKFTLNRTPCNPPQTPQTNSVVKSTKRRFLKEKEGYLLPGVQPRGGKGKMGGDYYEYEVSLDKIVTEYLRKQHALCPQPISTCPTMSLFKPHRCPEPLGKDSAALSIASRMFDRQMRPPYGGPNGQRLNRRYLHSKMCLMASYRDNAGDGLACCAFDCAADTIFMGSFAGELRAMPIVSSNDDYVTTVCHSSPIIHIATSMVNPDLIITGTRGASQNCALWGYNRGNDTCVLKYRFDEYHATLANLSHDRFIGTKDTVATIYDSATGTKLQTLYDESKANNYKFNEASFNPTDDLVLNDGNLWDVRSNKMIYKFDKFNQYTSGCFHPRGLEVIINSEIWDIRSFRLLHTVPALDQYQIMFNHAGDAIYAIRVDDELSGDAFLRRDYASTLRTFDALDYSSIGTFDLKTNSIFDLNIDRNDQLVGVIENSSRLYPDPEEAFCRVYELGKLRVPEDTPDEEEDNAQNDNGDYDDDDDDDDDDDNDDFDLGDDMDGSDEGSEDDVLELSPGSSGSSSSGGGGGGLDDDDNGELDDMLFELV